MATLPKVRDLGIAPPKSPPANEMVADAELAAAQRAIRSTEFP